MVPKRLYVTNNNPVYTSAGIQEKRNLHTLYWRAELISNRNIVPYPDGDRGLNTDLQPAQSQSSVTSFNAHEPLIFLLTLCSKDLSRPRHLTDPLLRPPVLSGREHLSSTTSDLSTTAVESPGVLWPQTKETKQQPPQFTLPQY